MPADYKWISDATESGDPRHWPEIVRVYQECPEFRWVILSHVPHYWLEHGELVAPLVREALRDKQLSDVALPAASICPSLFDAAVTALKETKPAGMFSVPVLACQLGLVSCVNAFEALPAAQRHRVRQKVEAELQRRYGPTITREVGLGT
jgi:hypothetical protein